MQAVILAGGLGTRLRPLTLNKPKPIVSIAGEPFLVRQLEALRAAGITDITLALGYNPGAIKTMLGDGSDYGVSLNYAVEPEALGTAGAFKFAGRDLEETTVVLNGDILTDLRVADAIATHKKCGGVGTLVLTHVEDPTQYGLVETNDANRILGFHEKPSHEELERLQIDTVNAGIYIFEPEVLDLIPEGEVYSFEKQVFPELVNSERGLFAFKTDMYWIDIGTHSRYLKAHRDILAGRVLTHRTDSSTPASNNGRATGSGFGDRVVLGEGAVVENSFIGDDTTIGPNARVSNSVIWSGTEIGTGAVVDASIIGSGCLIGEGVSIAKESVLGDLTILKNLKIKSRVSV